MGRKTTYKSTFLTNHGNLMHLATIAHHHKPWQKYTIDIQPAVGNIDTNLPWGEIRVWFSSAGVPMPKEWITSKESLEELYSDEKG